MAYRMVYNFRATGVYAGFYQLTFNEIGEYMTNQEQLEAIIQSTYKDMSDNQINERIAEILGVANCTVRAWRSSKPWGLNRNIKNRELDRLKELIG